MARKIYPSYSEINHLISESKYREDIEYWDGEVSMKLGWVPTELEELTRGNETSELFLDSDLAAELGNLRLMVKRYTEL